MKCYVHPDVDAVGTCTTCGKFVCANCAVDYQGKVTCKSCVEKMASSSRATGATVAAPVPAGRKEPILSLILSFFFPGLGQVYNGQAMKGIILLIAYFGMWILAGILAIFIIGLCLIPIPIIIWLYAMYDGYVTANKINSGIPA